MREDPGRNAMPTPTAARHAEATEALRKAGRTDLAARLGTATPDEMITTTQAARLLGGKSDPGTYSPADRHPRRGATKAPHR